MVQDVAEKACPQQQIGVYCGLFAMAICVHLFEAKEINEGLTQNHISKMRSILSSIFDKTSFVKQNHVQEMFPALDMLSEDFIGEET